MIHRSEDGHDPSGIGGSLSKNPCNRKVSASSMVLGDRNTSSTKTTELVVSKSYTILIAAHARSEDRILWRTTSVSLRVCLIWKSKTGSSNVCSWKDSSLFNAAQFLRRWFSVLTQTVTQTRKNQVELSVLERKLLWNFPSGKALKRFETFTNNIRPTFGTKRPRVRIPTLRPCRVSL